MIIASKVYQTIEEQPNDRGLSRKHILEALEAFLRCWGTDCLDLDLAHACDAENTSCRCPMLSMTCDGRARSTTSAPLTIPPGPGVVEGRKVPHSTF